MRVCRRRAVISLGGAVPALTEWPGPAAWPIRHELCLPGFPRPALSRCEAPGPRMDSRSAFAKPRVPVLARPGNSTGRDFFPGAGEPAAGRSPARLSRNHPPSAAISPDPGTGLSGDTRDRVGGRNMFSKKRRTNDEGEVLLATLTPEHLTYTPWELSPCS